MGKVLYYYPEDASEDNKLKKVGLCEAIIKFAESVDMSNMFRKFQIIFGDYIIYVVLL